MKRLCIIQFAALLIAALAASCTVDSIETPTPSADVVCGQVTVRASAAGLSTKTVYEESEGMLKTFWAANDSISVITYFKTSDFQAVLSVDNLHSTCLAGANEAEFTGTLSDISESLAGYQENYSGEVRRICYYPALKHSVVESWGSQYDQYSASQYDDPSYSNGDAYDTGWRGFHSLQASGLISTSDPVGILHQNDVMTGVLEGSAAEGFSSSLKKQYYVIKLDLDLSSHAGESIRGFRIGSDESKFSEFFYMRLLDNGDVDYIPDFDDSGCTQFLNAYYEGFDYVIPSDGKVTAYVPVKSEFTVKAGTSFFIMALKKDGSGVAAGTIVTPGRDLEFRKGSMYTLKCSFKKDTAAPEIINIPDARLKLWVVKDYDTDGDGEISRKEASLVSVLDCSNSNISSLEGVQHFVNLRMLICQNNTIETLELGDKPKLEYLGAGNTGIKTIDVTGCPALAALYVGSNQIESLDLSKNVALTDLQCSSNKLASLVLDNQTELTHLLCHNNQLTSLDVSHCTKLTSLYCDRNKLTSLDVSNSPELVYLSAHSNLLESLTLGQKPALANLQCNSNNSLAALDVKGCPDLRNLYCSNTKISALDLSACTALTYLYSYHSEIARLDLSKNNSLQYIDASSSGLEEIILPESPCVGFLNVNLCKLTALDVSRQTNLVNLGCKENQIKKLDLSKNHRLETINGGGNNLESLVLPDNDLMEFLDVNNCNLSSLDVSRYVKLRTLYCDYNRITELDLSNNTNLTYADCDPMSVNGVNVLKTVYVGTSDYSWLHYPSGTNVVVK